MLSDVGSSMSKIGRVAHGEGFDADSRRHLIAGDAVEHGGADAGAG
jgi:hypothetical protein